MLRRCGCSWAMKIQRARFSDLFDTLLHLHYEQLLVAILDVIRLDVGPLQILNELLIGYLKAGQGQDFINRFHNI